MVGRVSLLFGAFAMLACSGLRYGISDADLAKAREAAPRGVAIFAEQCARCHGQHGEGRSSTPPVLGPDALPEYPREQNPNAGLAAGDPEALRLKARSRPAGAPSRDPFRTAADPYGYVSRNMPPGEEARAAMTADDYWALVNFMLLSRGASVPSGGVTDNLVQWPCPNRLEGGIDPSDVAKFEIELIQGATYDFWVDDLAFYR